MEGIVCNKSLVNFVLAIEIWGRFHFHVYEQLLLVQIQKVQKASQVISVFFALLVSVCVKAAHETLVKLTPPREIGNIAVAMTYLPTKPLRAQFHQHLLDFTSVEPKSIKKTVKLSVFLCFQNLRAQKLRVNMLVKSTPVY